MTTTHPDLTQQFGETTARHDEADSTRRNRRQKFMAVLKAIAILAL